MENITGKAVVAQNFLRTRLYLIERFADRVRRHSFIIDAPRRYGKTSVVKEFMRLENEKPESQREFHIIFFELEATGTLNEFCCKLFKELLKLYRMRNGWEKLQRFFSESWNAVASRLSKVQLSDFGDLELHAVTGKFTFPEWKAKLTLLIRDLDNFDKSAVIVFDEFPDMLLNLKTNSNPSNYRTEVDSLMGWLRELRQDASNATKSHFVFCGSVNLRKTLETINLGKRINDLESFVIPRMAPEEAVVLIQDLSQAYNLQIADEAIDFMVSKIADGSPYYGQILMKALIDTSEREFSFVKVSGIYDDMLRAGNHDLNHFHTRLEDYLSSPELQCSRVMLKHLCGHAFHEKDLYDAHIHALCDYEAFQSVVARLIYEGYIARDTKEEGKLAFVSPLLKDWWACKAGVR